METFYLQIEVQKSDEDLLNGQPEGSTYEYVDQEEVLEKALIISQAMSKEIKAFLIINRHSTQGNEPCSKIEIDLLTGTLIEK